MSIDISQSFDWLKISASETEAWNKVNGHNEVDDQGKKQMTHSH